MFKDRFDAAYRLAALLQHYKNSDAIILAIPRGGLEIGYLLSQQLLIPLEVLLIKKIGHPANKELAIGAVTLFGRTVNAESNVSQQYIDEETERLRSELQDQQQQYEGQKEPASITNRPVIIVDDGIATGYSMFAAIDLVKRNNPASIAVAIPVAPKLVVEKLSNEAKEVFCLEAPPSFQAVGQYYQSFAQTRDTDALNYFKKANQQHIET